MVARYGKITRFLRLDSMRIIIIRLILDVLEIFLIADHSECGRYGSEKEEGMLSIPVALGVLPPSYLGEHPILIYQVINVGSSKKYLGYFGFD